MIFYEEGYYTYFVYIITNKYRSTFYVGMTNSLKRRLGEHRMNGKKVNKSFSSRYNIAFLVYYERFTWVQEAIVREKEIKRWSRNKKLALIRSFNPDFEFLNDLFEF